MLAKLSTEKISRRNAKRFRKSKKRNSEVCKAEVQKKEASDDCHAIEKAKSKRTEEMELA